MFVPSTPIDWQALQKSYFTELPRSEVFARRYYGRNVDLVAIENVIRNAEAGNMGPSTDLSRESKRNDPALEGMVARRIGSVASVDWDLTPPNSVEEIRARQIAEGTRSAFRRIRGFKQALYDLLYGVFDGRSALEIDWLVTTGEHRWMPRELGWIHPGRLSFGPQRELRVVERHRQSSFYYQTGPALEEMPGKFIWWLPRLFGDYPEREGLAPRILYWSFFKRFSWRHRMILTELFGLPWRIVEYEKEANVSPEKLDDDEQSAESLGGTTALALTPGAKLRVERAHPDSGDFFALTSTEVNEECAKLILGQSKTTDGDTTRAGGVVMQSEQDRIRQSDGDGVAERIQEQLVNVFVELNYGPDALIYAPKFQLRTAPPRDRKSELERVEKVISFGVPVARDEIYEISGLRKPMNGEPIVTAKTAPPADPMAPGAAKGPTGEVQKDGPGGSPAEDAVNDLLDMLDADLLNEPKAGDEDNDAQLVRLDGARQPDTVHGSPESLIERGVREGVRETASWARSLAEACNGIEQETALFTALQRAAASLQIERFTRAIERKIVHSLMLGALDSDWEWREDQPIAVVPFERHMLASGIQGFATKPFGEAIKAFAKKKVVSRRAFERLAAEAKKRAFTITGLAKQSMLETAHAELTTAITAGADLRTFRSALEQRFESAGWTNLNASHVEVVFRNGVMGAYSEGRREQMRQPEVLAARPYWQIRGVKDDRARETHRRVHNLVLRADDPFWKRSYPPFGHNCRCRVISRSQADVERLGLQVTSGAGITDLPDEGWESSAP